MYINIQLKNTCNIYTIVNSYRIIYILVIYALLQFKKHSSTVMEKSKHRPLTPQQIIVNLNNIVNIIINFIVS